MEKEKEFPKRKIMRLQTFDYSSNGAYFITVCTKDRRSVLSKIVGDDVLGVPENARVELLPYGKIADKYIKQMSDFYDDIEIEHYVIMPNHIHLLLSVYMGGWNGTPRTSSPTRQTATISHFISSFKRFCDKEYGENIWQRSFYDHLIRNRHDYIEIAKYIEENPAKWREDELYSE